MTTRKQQLTALAERVEGLSGPDREVDAAIAVTSGRYVWEKRERDRQEWFYPVGGNRYERRALYYGSTGQTLERYTASLDAAMSLVRPEWADSVNLTAYRAIVWDSIGRANGEDAIGRMARALTAACLRAIAEGEQ